MHLYAYTFDRQALTVQKLVSARGLHCRYEPAPKWPSRYVHVPALSRSGPVERVSQA